MTATCTWDFIRPSPSSNCRDADHPPATAERLLPPGTNVHTHVYGDGWGGASLEAKAEGAGSDARPRRLDRGGASDSDRGGRGFGQGLPPGRSARRHPRQLLLAFQKPG